MPQNNPFDITGTHKEAKEKLQEKLAYFRNSNSELIPFQEQEVEAVFKTPELDDFLLPPVLGDQITDTTLMHRHSPKQTDIDRIMEQINRKYLAKLQLPCSIRDTASSLFEQPTLQRYLHGCRYE